MVDGVFMDDELLPLDDDVEDPDPPPPWFDKLHRYFRPIRSPFFWNMSPNQPPMPVLASRHYPPPIWPLRRRKDWEILPPPGIFPALKPWQTDFRSPRFGAFAIQHGERNPNIAQVGAQLAEEGAELRRRRGRPRNGDRERVTSDWPTGGGAE
jgi:hypothetical protein